ncbi:MAG TPA: ATP-binding protein [Kofleriaceae bacterium]|nr:ATP-binding protein [Kofleriaceae bacterium]
MLRSVPLNREARTELDPLLAAQREKFISKFGREPGPDDPVFFDLDEDKLRDDTAEAMRASGIRPALIYAYEETGFVIDCPADLEAVFDVGLVERVLHNLVGNALRYCRQGGTITLGCRRWQEADGSVEISVSNTGPQVPEAIRPNLFGKYVRSTTGKRGMGLYFCSLVANAHGGSIAYEARNDGPCFVIRLPPRA